MQIKKVKTNVTQLATRQTSIAPVDPVRGLGYRADIDGLRGIAILLVMLFHAGVPWVRGGYSGVDIFFVISGYLIGFQVTNELNQQRFALLPFYKKRVRRVFPALFVVIFFCLLAGWVLFDGQELRVLGEQTGTATISLSNVYYWATTNYFSPNAHLQTLLMTWSLGIEVQFYLLLPLVALALHRRGKAMFLWLMVVSSLLSIVYATLGMHKAWPGAFFLLTGRWWELAAGVVLASVEVYARRPAALLQGAAAEVCGVAGLLGIAASIALPEPHAQLLVPPVCISILAAVLLCMSAQSWVNREVLSLRMLSALGRRSYSIYLWHWPFLSLGYLCGASYLAPRGRVLLLALTFVIAEISYRYVELPFRRSQNKSRSLRIIAAMGTVVLLVSAMFFVTHGWPSRNPVASQVETSVRGDGIARMCLAGDSGSVETMPAACVSPTASVALLGDSHAAALAPAVRELSPQLEMLMKSSCPPLLNVTVRGSGSDRCSTFVRDAVARLAADRSVHTVLVAGYWLNPAYDPTHEMRYVTAARYDAATTYEQSWTNLHDGLLALCLALRGTGKDVVLVEDVPIVRYDPHLLAVGNTMPIRGRWGRWLASTPSWSEREPHPVTPEELRMRSMLLDVATRVGGKVVSLYQPLCDGISCKVMDAGKPFFEDRQHLSALGARTLLQPSGLATALQPSARVAAYNGPERP